MGIFLSALAGVLFAITGIAYKIGDTGKVQTIQCGAFLSAFGMFMFGVLGRNEWSSCTVPVIIASLVVGVLQYMVMRLLKTALKLGPLSPAWCATSLAFIPVIVYAAVACNDSLSRLQYLSIIATAGAIISASLGTKSSGEAVKTTWKGKILYGILLLLLLFFNSTLSIALKYFSVHNLPGQTVSIKNGCGNAIFSIIYMTILTCASLELTLQRAWVFNRQAFWGGLLLALGATSAFGIQLYLVDKVSAVIVFALSNTVSILGTALISAFVFREKRNASWYATVLFSIAAILLNR